MGEIVIGPGLVRDRVQAVAPAHVGGVAVRQTGA
jgi:hypothetical protein